MKISIEELKEMINRDKEERDKLNRNISALSVKIQMQEEILREKEEYSIGKYYNVRVPEHRDLNFPAYFLPIRIRDSRDVFTGLYLNPDSTEPINTNGGVNGCWLTKGREITPKEFWEKFDKIVEGIKAKYCVVWKNE